MKYIIFILLFILWPQQGYTKAICRAGITQAECCATDPTGANLTLIKQRLKQLFGNKLRYKRVFRRLLHMYGGYFSDTAFMQRQNTGRKHAK